MTAIQRQLVRMYMVLGVVEDDGRKTHVFGALVLAQRRPQPVEIVALGRRTLAAAHHQPQSTVAPNQRLYREQRRGHVGVSADLKPDILSLPQLVQHSLSARVCTHV